MSVRDRLAEVLAELLRGDARRVLLGEDVVDGGILGLSRLVAADPSLAGRIIATPLTSEAGIAHAAGLALGGARPIVLLPSSFALVEGLAAIREVAALRDRAGQLAQVLFVAPNGAGFGLGIDGATNFESAVQLVPGLRIRTAGRGEDLDRALRHAAHFDEGQGPIVLLLPRTSLLESLEADAGSQPDAFQPIVERRAPAEPRATVFCWGASVAPSMLAADAAAEAGRPVALFELCELAPLDPAVVVAAAAKTGKIVIVHEGASRHGFGAELAAIVADAAILHLDAPVLRVTGSEPASFSNELAAIPTAAAIADAIMTVADY